MKTYILYYVPQTKSAFIQAESRQEALEKFYASEIPYSEIEELEELYPAEED